MLVKQVDYVDYNGDKRSDTLYFNLSEVEIARLEVKFPGGLQTYVERLNAQERPDEVLDLFETVLSMSYGVKSEDGRYFHKPPEKTEAFKESAAYNKLFRELLSNTDTAVNFFNSLIFVQPE